MSFAALKPFEVRDSGDLNYSVPDVKPSVSYIPSVPPIIKAYHSGTGHVVWKEVEFATFYQIEMLTDTNDWVVNRISTVGDYLGPTGVPGHSVDISFIFLTSGHDYVRVRAGNSYGLSAPSPALKVV